MAGDAIQAPISKRCRWFGVPRRTLYYRPQKAAPKLQSQLVEPIKEVIEENPSFGYRIVAGLLGSNNGLVFTSHKYTSQVKSYGLQQEFITPYTPEQNGMVERVIRTLKEQCAHRHRVESLAHASRVIADWIGFYNHRRPHQALGMKAPAMAYQFAESAGALQ